MAAKKKKGKKKSARKAGFPPPAPSFLFLACADSAYMTGQVLHPNGGGIING